MGNERSDERISACCTGTASRTVTNATAMASTTGTRWFLPREQRRRLRNLFAYQFTGPRLAHLTDAEPRCTICRTNLRSVA